MTIYIFMGHGCVLTQEGCINWVGNTALNYMPLSLVHMQTTDWYEYKFVLSFFWFPSPPPLYQKFDFCPPPPTKSMKWCNLAIQPKSHQWFSECHSLYSLQTCRWLSPARYTFCNFTKLQFVQHRNKNDNIFQCFCCLVSLNQTKEQQPFTKHNVAASKVQQKVE